MKPLSIYIHIPYCIQRCRYCDFTTFEQSTIMPPEEYVELVKHEIRNRGQGLRDRQVQSIYFGGGTPSLIRPELIVALLHELANHGLKINPSTEVSIEINPATLDQRSLDIYLEAGINRFSVGAQSFDDELLKLCGREHSAADTRRTLDLLKDQNYSFDLLFALPSQTLDQLQKDLDEVVFYKPPHLSAYCLTVPSGHPMDLGRPPEDTQLEMFQMIEERLRSIGILKYEISNFSLPGMESRHNQSYWSEQDYWGLGLSAHSYLGVAPEGIRFWNPKSFDHYTRQVQKRVDLPYQALPADQLEILQLYEALTDYSHMFLRTTRGLSRAALQNRFPDHAYLILQRLEELLEEGLLTQTPLGFCLSPAGQLVSNQVFLRLTFLKSEIPRNIAP